MRTINTIAPAKVNLFLGIGPKQPDGYHQALSVMHALLLHDNLSFTQYLPGDHQREVPQGEGLVIEIRTTFSEGLPEEPIEVEDNLVAKAMRALAQEVGREDDELITVSVEKHIPSQAGLGGGSSDAAAALVACGMLWGIPRDDDRLKKVAASLGADVPFFLHGGCVVMDGRGDCFVRALKPDNGFVVLMRPDSGVSTAEAYRTFDANPIYPPQAAIDQVANAQAASEIDLFNNLDAPAESLNPEIRAVHELAQEAAGVQAVMMSGSGSAVFARCESLSAAQQLSLRVRTAGYWARVTNFSALKTAVVR